MIVLDCGVVLTDHRDALPRLAAMLDVDQAALAGVFWELRPPYDAGQPDEEYWGLVAARLDRPCDADLARALTDVDLGAWATIRPATDALLQALARRGDDVVMLSNAPASFRRHLEVQAWTRPFRQLVLSGELGVSKPDPAIYAHVEALADGAPIRFVDDRQPNVDAALARGWDAHLWVSDADTAAWLGLPA